MTDLSKLKKSLQNLEHALKIFEKEKKNPLHSAAVSKLFEVCFEYTWKTLKSHIQRSGLEAYSPRDVIKAAGQTHIIENVEKWLEFLEDRNLSVHDYIGIDDKDYLKSIQDFSVDLKVVLKRLEK